MALAIKFNEYIKRKSIILQDGEKLKILSYYMDSVTYLEASGDHLRQIIQDFTPVAYIATAYCRVTIPVSGSKSQRWYGDTAKTIIYALLQ